MYAPVALDAAALFSPLAKTPATNLTRDLPIEESVDILLLGCSDVCNILFTLYADQRPARNILLFTLLLDTTDNGNDDHIWSIYYELRIKNAALDLLRKQAKKLATLAGSIHKWHASQYGKMLRFCDDSTLDSVKNVWFSYYRVLLLPEPERQSLLKSLEDEAQKHFRVHALRSNSKDLERRAAILSGSGRSAAQMGIASLKDITLYHPYYWNYGHLDSDFKDESVLKHRKWDLAALDPARRSTTGLRNANPMFVTGGTDVLDWSTDPLTGFHLSIPYALLAKGSPLGSNPLTGSSSTFNLIKAVRAEFRAWSKALRKRNSKNLTIRFFCGDAIALSYALQRKDNNAVFRDPYRLTPIAFNAKDYGVKGDAPTSFNVIDTAQLCDTIGTLNILVAVLPLLRNEVSASIFTHKLMKHHDNHKEYMENVLCGHLPTVSTLLGLFPVEYWTNASVISTSAEQLVNDKNKTLMKAFAMAGQLDQSQLANQMPVRLTWKHQTVAWDPKMLEVMPTMSVQAGGCALLLFHIYLHMLGLEGKNQASSYADAIDFKELAGPLYLHRSFALLLSLVRRTVTVNWDDMMADLISLIEKDDRLVLRKSYKEELYVQLHVMEVFSAANLLSPSVSSKLPGIGLAFWKDIPAVVCVTVRVPCSKLDWLKVLREERPIALGTPPLHCTLRSPMSDGDGKAWTHNFSSIQLCFGRITTQGSRKTEEFRVGVQEDLLGWKGSSDLTVSFQVPSDTLLLETQTTKVAFGFQKTPHSTSIFSSILGEDLSIFDAALGDEENVFISKDFPSEYMDTPACRPPAGDLAVISTVKAQTVLSASINSFTGRISTITRRLNIVSSEVKAALVRGAEIKVSQISACNFEISVNNNVEEQSFSFLLGFPMPVLGSKMRTRIARKSSYVELEAPLADEAAFKSFPHFIHPTFLVSGKPVLWNLPSLKIDCLPIIDISKASELDWLADRSYEAFSKAEHAERSRALPLKAPLSIRTGFKDTIFSMYQYFCGLFRYPQKSAFVLGESASLDFALLVFVSSVRLDISNGTTVLDAAILPMTPELIQRLKRQPDCFQLDSCSLTMEEEELKFWKCALPGMIERCRAEPHRDGCEYAATSRIPLSTKSDEMALCSCGKGNFPPDFKPDVPRWSGISKECFRAAIPLFYPAPFAEPLLDWSAVNSPNGVINVGCSRCQRHTSADGKELQKCSQCKYALYCSKDCQQADWKTHKMHCKVQKLMFIV
ncbi:hypothetical protein BT63DRAFT_470575 [Microthyrium microscopicum]|uniref:MYND-type domain-containing protein n=1 Tax=Microthyrium microscopicum TaxID=703497 RepID=A0A6A6U9Y8_9PEZI|nr:hypothetical protein BT63DRAFT_470575 [Microthyrium microscopicum]